MQRPGPGTWARSFAVRVLQWGPPDTKTPAEGTQPDTPCNSGVLR